MREIKFRAWDKNKKKMFYPKSFDERMVLQFSGVVGLFNKNKMYDDVTQDYEIMQFTGLLDKHGREIYEGDILQCFDSLGQLLHFVDFEDGRFVIEYIGNGRGKNRGGINQDGVSEFNNRIIGNVYENPELLN